MSALNQVHQPPQQANSQSKRVYTCAGYRHNRRQCICVTQTKHSRSRSWRSDLLKLTSHILQQKQAMLAPAQTLLATSGAKRLTSKQWGLRYTSPWLLQCRCRWLSCGHSCSWRSTWLLLLRLLLIGIALQALGGLGCCGFTLPGFGPRQGDPQSLRYLVQSIHFMSLQQSAASCLEHPCSGSNWFD